MPPSNELVAISLRKEESSMESSEGATKEKIRSGPIRFGCVDAACSEAPNASDTRAAAVTAKIPEAFPPPAPIEMQEADHATEDSCNASTQVASYAKHETEKQAADK